MKLILQIVLVLTAIFLGYKIFNSINEPTKFNTEKIKRYQVVVNKLKDLRAAELAHLEITGKFTDSYDTLVKFIETSQYAITQRRDTSYPDVARNRAFNLDPLTGGYYLEDVVIDTLGFISVKDSLFKNSDRYKNLSKVTVEGQEIPITLKAGFIERNERQMPVFEASAKKDDILHGMSSDLVIQEKQVVAVDGINGAEVTVGSMTDINTTGNWPKRYDSSKDE